MQTHAEFRRRLSALVSVVAAILAFAPGRAVAEEVDFRKDIAPLLEKHCLRCHAGEKPKGLLDLASKKGLAEGGESGAAIVPGKAKESLLMRHLEDGKMPPNAPLPKERVAVFAKWVDAGAPWAGGNLQPPKAAERAGLDWWSLQPIRAVTPPAADSEWSRNPIDQFIRAKQKAMGLTPNPEADRRTLIRRLTLDLTGLLPTPQEVADFEKDPSPQAYEKLVDRLLASPSYGESWARHWLDVVRFAESHGYEMNTLRPNAWHYRDYVIAAFNRDLPFADFVRHQLAADADPKATALELGATGYLVAGPHDLVGNATPEGELQKRDDDKFDMVATTGSSFLGLTIGCARCHDHKFDPISQKDFYAVQSIFAGVEHAESPLPSFGDSKRVARVAELNRELAQIEKRLEEFEPLAQPDPKDAKPTRAAASPLRNVERLSPIKAKFLRMTILRTNDGTQPCVEEIEVFGTEREKGNLALASRGVKATASSEYPNAAIHKIGHINDGKFGNSWSWISNEAGAGWIQLEFPEEVEMAVLVWARDREGTFRDRLAVDYRFDVSADGKAWRPVAGSWDRETAASKNNSSAGESKQLRDRKTKLLEEIKTISNPPLAYRGRFRKPDDTYILKRGDVMQTGDPVGPASLSAIPLKMELDEPKNERSRREAFANWMVRPDNPLPARVFVNRLWHYHFGQGLVRTPSDFGFNGDRPSHPELLDWLAAEFLRSGGSTKQMHRLMVMSSTYRQAGRIDEEKAKIDAGNRYLWRFGSRRMEAERIRDTVLQVTDSLNRKAGGPGYNLWDYSGYVIVFTPKAKLGPEEFRRMVYQFKPRTQQDTTFGIFDCPDATSVAPKRSVSTTPLQALNLFNDAFMLDQADRLARRIGDLAGAKVESQVTMLFELAFNRQPSARERAAAAKLVAEHGLAALCRAILNSNEFLTLE